MSSISPATRPRPARPLAATSARASSPCPSLHLLQISDEAERHRLSEIILNGDEADIVVLAERAIAAGAVKSAIATGRKMLLDAEKQLRLVPENKYRDALSNLVTTLDRMIGQFSV